MYKDILRMENITKIYPNGVIANQKVNFSVAQGEIHALMGENGAGKSTLMKILFGIEKQQEGCIYCKGNPIQICSPEEAMNHGICMVHQHFMLIPSFSVVENMVLGIEPLKKGLLDMNKAIKMTEDISQKYNLYVDPQEKVEYLSMGQKQKVEILKALLRGADILILDEPTSVLTPQETQELFFELKTLKERGHTIVFISHKLREIKQIADRITVLRNGKFEAMVSASDVTEQEISRLMVGRDVILKVKKNKSSPKQVCLNLKGVEYSNHSGKKMLKNINFNVRSGEIVGIAGVEGNGQSLLVDLIAGMQHIQEGNITINGNCINTLSVREIRKLGTSHIPEDRMSYGSAMNTSIENNLISNQFYKQMYNNFFLLNIKKIKSHAKKLVSEYGIKCNSVMQYIKNLSGGNIQKVIVAREFYAEPTVLIANQPSRGIDVGSAEFIYQKLICLRDAGTAVLLVSADLNEVMELSDRLLVMYNGEIVAHFTDVSSVSEIEVGQYMLGIKKQPAQDIEG